MWLRWGVAPLCFLAGSWAASSRRLPAFVPITAGLVTPLGDDTNRRRSLLADATSTTPCKGRSRVGVAAGPGGGIGGTLLSTSRYSSPRRSNVGNLRLARHIHEKGGSSNRMGQNFAGAKDDRACEDGEQSEEDQPDTMVSFAIVGRTAASQSSRNRQEARCNSTRRDKSNPPVVPPAVGEAEEEDNSQQQVGLAVAVNGGPSGRGDSTGAVVQWRNWLPWVNRIAESTPTGINAQNIASSQGEKLGSDGQIVNTSASTSTSTNLKPTRDESRAIEPPYPPMTPVPLVTPVTTKRLEPPVDGMRVSLFTIRPRWPWPRTDKQLGDQQIISENEASPALPIFPSSDSFPSALLSGSWIPGLGNDQDESKGSGGGYKGEITEQEVRGVPSGASARFVDIGTNDDRAARVQVSRSHAREPAGLRSRSDPPVSPKRSGGLTRVRNAVRKPVLQLGRPFRWAAAAGGVSANRTKSGSISNVEKDGAAPVNEAPPSSSSEGGNDPEIIASSESTTASELPLLPTIPTSIVSATPAKRKRMLARVKTAVERPLSAVSRPFRSAASVPAVPPANAGSLRKTASSSSYPAPASLDSLPPATEALRRRREDNPFFPVRAPRRPPGYRWVVSRFSSSTAPRPTVIGGSTAGDTQTKTIGIIASSGPPLSDSSMVVTEDDEIEALRKGTRRMGVYTTLSGLTGKIVDRLRRRVAEPEKNSDLTAQLVSEDHNTFPAQSIAIDPGGDSDIDADLSTNATMSWWEAGAAVAIGVGAGLAGPIIDGLSRLPTAPNGSSPPGVPAEVAKHKVLQTQRESGPNDPSRRGDIPVSFPPTQTTAVTEAMAAPPSRRRNPLLIGVGALFGKAATTSRRAKLWLLLRRTSRARAEPLLPDVDTAISTLSLPLKASGNMSAVEKAEATPAEVPKSVAGGGLYPEASVGAAAAATAPVGSPTMATVAGETGSEVCASQAVDGGGWNLFGFFPKDKDDEQHNTVDTTEMPTTTAAVTSATTGSSEAASSTDLDGSRAENSRPMLAWAGRYDPKAQVGWSSRSRVSGCAESLVSREGKEDL